MRPLRGLLDHHEGGGAAPARRARRTCWSSSREAAYRDPATTCERAPTLLDQHERANRADETIPPCWSSSREAAYRDPPTAVRAAVGSRCTRRPPPRSARELCWSSASLPASAPTTPIATSPTSLHEPNVPTRSPPPPPARETTPGTQNPPLPTSRSSFREPNPSHPTSGTQNDPRHVESADSCEPRLTSRAERPHSPRNTYLRHAKPPSARGIGLFLRAGARFTCRTSPLAMKHPPPARGITLGTRKPPVSASPGRVHEPKVLAGTAAAPANNEGPPTVRSRALRGEAA